MMAASTADAAHVCLMESSHGNVKLEALRHAVASLNAWGARQCPIATHLVLRNVSAVPSDLDVTAHALELPDALRPVLQRLVQLAESDPKRIARQVEPYLYKAFLPWLLPEVRRCILVDYADFVFLESPCRLWREFDALGSTAALAMAEDVAGNVLYPSLPLKPNSGLVLMDLHRLRQRPEYLRALARHSKSVGDLADQTLFAQLSADQPALFHQLSCMWNRQLNMHTPVPSARYRCADGCAALHTNGVRVKWLARALHRNSSCAMLRGLAASSRQRAVRTILRTTAGGCCGIGVARWDS